jgi:nitrite reductase/ring-hydroxylating ferredoxin subunit
MTTREAARHARNAARLKVQEALETHVPHLWYCLSAADLGLGQCRCESHGALFGRRDGEPLTQDDIDAFWAAVASA